MLTIEVRFVTVAVTTLYLMAFLYAFELPVAQLGSSSSGPGSHYTGYTALGLGGGSFGHTILSRRLMRHDVVVRPWLFVKLSFFNAYVDQNVRSDEIHLTGDLGGGIVGFGGGGGAVEDYRMY